MVDKIKIRFAEDICKPNRITSDKATFRMKRHSACTNFLKQEVMTSTLSDLEVTGLICGSQIVRARSGAKNATLFFNIMLFAKHSFMYTGFLCVFLNIFVQLC